jgi:hypothetical protein
MDAVLLKEPEHPSIWADLIPFFGDKKVLKMHFGRLPPKAVTKRWNLLFKARAEKYQDYLSGHKELPNVKDHWYARHPNSVIMERMPGVKFSKSSVLLTRPKMGLRDTGALGKLFHMTQMGYLSAQLPKPFAKLSRTERIFLALGWTNELTYKEFHLPLEGLGEDILSTHYADLEQFFERTGLSVVTLLGNPVSECTKHWRDVPQLMLCDVYRMENYFRRAGKPWHTDLAQFFQSKIMGKPTQPLDEPWGLAYVEDMAQETKEFLDSLRNQAPDLLDLEEVNQVISSFANRIVPKFINDQQGSLPGSVVTDKYSKEEESLPPLEISDPSADSWQLPDEGYDVWAFLES